MHGVQDSTHDATQRPPHDALLCSALLCFLGTSYWYIHTASTCFSRFRDTTGVRLASLPNKPKRQGTLQTPGLSRYLVIAMTPTTCCYWQ
ncbi:hypothetical protein V8C43DRAFT_267333 [Trichoderma afarasin]